jgi:hypothetical protein
MVDETTPMIITSAHFSSGMCDVNIQRYARAFCYAIGCGGQYSTAQVRCVEDGFRRRRYHQEVVESVAEMMKDATSMTLPAVVMRVQLLLEPLRLSEAARVDMVTTMFRVSALSDFPESQVCAISMIAQELEIPSGVIRSIETTVEKELTHRQSRDTSERQRAAAASPTVP